MPIIKEIDNIDFEDLDETFVERLIGLTEMFPASFRNFISNTFTTGLSITKTSYNLARKGVWICYTSSIILLTPVMIEVERLVMEQQMQRQVLLGPGESLKNL